MEPTPTNQPIEVIREIYRMVSGGRDIDSEMTWDEMALKLEILADEVQGLIEVECLYLFDEKGELR